MIEAEFDRDNEEMLECVSGVERERERMCVCVCVCVREREREREKRDPGRQDKTDKHLIGRTEADSTWMSAQKFQIKNTTDFHKQQIMNLILFCPSFFWIPSLITINLNP